MTYDDWKTTDDTPDMRDPCDYCGLACRAADIPYPGCACCDRCIEENREPENSHDETWFQCVECGKPISPGGEYPATPHPEADPVCYDCGPRRKELEGEK